ncbi:MAG: NAD-dependent epimerase/dehydratase family protein [Desulfovibrio sp.]|jgi:NADH dehydrogenase|nr:NAD-dependent epimerase/dehydratase family protein [Desulfovibrio sp.]
MNILVIGASGFLGRSLLPLLLHDERVDSVTAITHNAPLPRQFTGSKLTALSVKKFFRPEFDRTERHYDTVICLSGRTYSQTRDEAVIRESNLDLPMRIINFCRERQAGHLILASSINVRFAAAHNRGYPLYKKQAEEYLAASGVPYTIFRPSLIIGRGDAGFSRLIRYIRNHRLVPVFGNGRKLEQPIHVDEAAAFFHQAAVFPPVNAVFEIGGMEAMTYNTMLFRIADILQRRIRLLHIPARPLYLGLTLLERIGLGLPVNSEQIMHIDTDLDIDNTKALQQYNVKLTAFECLLREYIRGRYVSRSL